MFLPAGEDAQGAPTVKPTTYSLDPESVVAREDYLSEDYGWHDAKTGTWWCVALDHDAEVAYTYVWGVDMVLP